MAIQPDGLGTTLTFVSTAFVMELTSITAPALDGGDPIDLTYLGSTKWRLKHVRTLKDIEQIAFAGHFDPAIYVAAALNVNQSIYITFPTLDKLTFFGYLRRLEAGPAVEGEKIECTGIVEITNNNGSEVETAPTYTAAP